MRDKKLLYKNIFASLVLIAGVGLVLFYIFFKERTEYHVDVTDTLLWGAAMLDGGSIYNPDFWYAYNIPFSGAILMIPFVKAFGITYLTQMLGMAAFAMVFVIALYFCLRALSFEHFQCTAVTGLLMIFLCASKVTRMIFFCHVIHYSLGMLFTFVAIILIKGMEKKYLLSLISLLVWIFCCSINGVSSFMFFLFPLLAAYILEKWIFYKELYKKEIIKLLKEPLFMLTAGVAGYIFRILYIGNNEYEAHFSSFLPSDQWMFKNNRFINQWVNLFTDDVFGNQSFFSKEGIFLILETLAALIILVLPLLLMMYIIFRRENRMLILLNLDYGAVFLLTMYIYSISTVSNQNWRLCELYGMAVFISLTDLFFLMKDIRLRTLSILLLFLLSLGALVYCYKVIAEIDGSRYACRHDRMVKFLDENDLTVGYSNLYNSANAVTILSDSRIMVSPIELNRDGSYNVYKYQSMADWYKKEAERYFVVVSNEEKEWTKEALLDNCIEELEFDEDTSVLVFDKNIFDENLGASFKSGGK